MLINCVFKMIFKVEETNYISDTQEGNTTLFFLSMYDKNISYHYDSIFEQGSFIEMSKVPYVCIYYNLYTFTNIFLKLHYKSDNFLF